MALTPPDTSDLELHMRLDTSFSGREIDWAEDSIQRATDLMEIATGMHLDPNITDPEDELGQRIMTQGILAMAQSIYVTSGEDRSNLYSPYSSERLGSYSYTLKAVQERRDTGILDFDIAVQYFKGLLTGDQAEFGVTSEHVFKQPYDPSPTLDTLRDPVVPLARDAFNQ